MGNGFMEYENLSFTDDFMFCRVMTEDALLCRDLLSVCTGLDIGKLTYMNGQQSFKVTKDGHGVRLDVYAEDDSNRAFDLDMEASRKDDYGKRTAYYMGMMGRHQLKVAESYSQLRDNYVIFIMPFNLFQDSGLHRYTFSLKCEETPVVDFPAENKIIFICGGGLKDKSDVPEGLAAVIEYLETGVPCDDLTKRIDDAVSRARSNRDWKEDYMDLYYKLQEYREIGKEEGKKIGKQEASAEILREKERADAAESRADAAESRLDAAENRADAAESRADAAEAELALYKEKFGIL